MRWDDCEAEIKLIQERCVDILMMMMVFDDNDDEIFENITFSTCRLPLFFSYACKMTKEIEE